MRRRRTVPKCAACCLYAHPAVPNGHAWREEPRQRPDFTEYTVVLKGMLQVEHDGGVIDVHAGQAVIALPGERVRYRTPLAEGAEYIAVCTPAFSPDTVHRED